MIQRKSDDILVVGHCPERQVRVFYAEVAETARTLASRHACGPASALVLAEVLAAAGILGADLEAASARICLRVTYGGPIGEVVAEMDGDGRLRGYPERKSLPEFDDREELNRAEVTGSSARVSILQAGADGQVTSQADFAVLPGGIQEVLQVHSRLVLQRAMLAAFCITVTDDRLDGACGLAVQGMPGGDPGLLAGLEGIFGDGTVSERLSVDPSLDSIRELLDLPKLRVGASRTPSFGCRCSREKAKTSLEAMTIQELNRIRRTGRDQSVSCPLCGAEYPFSSAEFGAMIGKRNPPPTA